jgi:hypothetical protein
VASSSPKYPASERVVGATTRTSPSAHYEAYEAEKATLPDPATV